MYEVYYQSNWLSMAIIDTTIRWFVNAMDMKSFILKFGFLFFMFSEDSAINTTPRDVSTATAKNGARHPYECASLPPKILLIIWASHVLNMMRLIVLAVCSSGKYPE
jgi:hypothetical protein